MPKAKIGIELERDNLPLNEVEWYVQEFLASLRKQYACIGKVIHITLESS